MQVRRSDDRGRSAASWLESRHGFSFADYFDPAHMGFRSMRVLNEDWIAHGQGFGPHPHRDMEILTFPLAGAIEHRDSSGSHSVIEPGGVQLMTAGTGIVHSEMNPSAHEVAHLLQVWIVPERAGLVPRHREMQFDPDVLGLTPLVTPDGRGDTLRIHQDATIQVLRLAAGGRQDFEIAPGRHAWLQITQGTGRVGDTDVAAGDAVAVSNEPKWAISTDHGLSALVFDLA